MGSEMCIRDSSKDGIGGRLANEFVNDAELPMLISAGAGYDLFLNHATQPVYGVLPSGLVVMPDHDVSQPGRFSRASTVARRAALDRLNALGAGNKNLFVKHSGELLQQGLI